MTRHITVCLGILLFSSWTAAQERLSHDSVDRQALLTRAYAALRVNTSDALPLFEEALHRDSASVLIHRQLGSIYLSLGRPEDALARFKSANRLLPSDTTRLQIAYLLNSLGRLSQAYDAFDDLRGSADPGIRSTARGAVAILGPFECSSAPSGWTRVYAAPYYDTRFRNMVLFGSLHHGVPITDNRDISLFGTVSVTRDTRSAGGAAPVIYSDNYFLAGAGIRFQPLPGLLGDIQGGVTVDLLKRPSTAGTRGDFRAVASYGSGRFPEIHVPPSAASPWSPFLETYASFGYYSRYKNGIGYAQLRAGARVFEYRYTAVDLYIRGDGAFDTRSDFFNNVAEVGAGIRWIPDHRWGIQALVEYHRGTYWGPGRSSVPFDLTYNSVRVFLLLDRFLCL